MRVPLLVALTSLAHTPLICEAKTPLERLDEQRLEAVHAQRVEWMKQRVATQALGVYTDFRAVHVADAGSPEQLLRAAQAAEVRIVLSAKAPSWSGMHDGVLFLDRAGSDQEQRLFPDETAKLLPMTLKQQRRLRSKFKQYPDEVYAVAGEALLGPPGDLQLTSAFRNMSTHILAREMAEAEIRASLVAGHVYQAHDWLCDPAGFSFDADTDVGVYDMGDDVPLMHTTIQARVPIRAKLKLLRNGAVVAEVNDSTMKYAVTEEGAYRLEAWLTIDGEDRPWIYSNPLNIHNPTGIVAPPIEIPANVEVRKDIVYTEGDSADAPKHRLDLYLPKDKTNFPVLVFIYGGAWSSGNRSMYELIGYGFARLGMAVAIPNYRLMPKNPHPAQIDDVAAAFAWVYQNLPRLGGDVKRFYLIGHSSGGHLAALLALDPGYLQKYKIPASAVRGVAALSGLYDVSRVSGFRSDAGARDASPLHLVHPHAPPFLVTYCQWDYAGLPKQARDFTTALKKDFVAAQLTYIPGENHIGELMNLWKDDDPLVRAILNFIQ